MLVIPDRLSPADLAAIAELERRVVAADGGRLKLEWDSLRSRTPGVPSDALWWDGDRLTGFAGVYVFGSMTPEIAGMVDPEFRRRGAGTALLEAALRLAGQRERPSALVVVPRACAGGAELARRHGGQPDHSEHALVLTGDPVPGTGAELPITLRDAVASDIPLVTQLLRSAFGFEAALDPTQLVTPSARTVVVELAGEPVATLRVALNEAPLGDTPLGDNSLRVKGAGIYGFGVRDDLRGRGIGGAALVRICRELRADGVERIALEVSVDNEHALGLYTRIGFAPVTTEDYYRLATISAAG